MGWAPGRGASRRGNSCTADPARPAPIIEKVLSHSRDFTVASIALFLYSAGFSIFLLGSALFVQDVWHYDPLRVGVAIAPAPVVAIGVAVGADPAPVRTQAPRGRRHP